MGDFWPDPTTNAVAGTGKGKDGKGKDGEGKGGKGKDGKGKDTSFFQGRYDDVVENLVDLRGSREVKGHLRIASAHAVKPDVSALLTSLIARQILLFQGPDALEISVHWNCKVCTDLLDAFKSSDLGISANSSWSDWRSFDGDQSKPQVFPACASLRLGKALRVRVYGQRTFMFVETLIVKATSRATLTLGRLLLQSIADTLGPAEDAGLVELVEQPDFGIPTWAVCDVCQKVCNFHVDLHCPCCQLSVCPGCHDRRQHLFGFYLPSHTEGLIKRSSGYIAFKYSPSWDLMLCVTCCRGDGGV